MEIHLWRTAHKRHNVAPRALDGLGQGVMEVLASPTTMVATYYAGLGFMYFTFFYSFFNWWHYREMRERWDAEDKKDDDLD